MEVRPGHCAHHQTGTVWVASGVGGARVRIRGLYGRSERVGMVTLPVACCAASSARGSPAGWNGRFDLRGV